MITVQLGHYANHVGAHFWNLQENSFSYDDTGGGGGDGKRRPAVNHSVLYREGETMAGEVTFTPRLVCVDLKGSLGLLPEYGDLYQDRANRKKEAGSMLWSGDSAVQKEEPKRKNDFQRELETSENMEGDGDKDVCETNDETVKLYDLDDQVDVWSDFVLARYHHRSNVILREYQHRNQVQPFDVFGLGRECWRREEEIEDRIRYFAEEADSVAGFQLLVDNFDGFAGIGAGLTDLLADDYCGKSVVAFPTSPARYSEYSAKANSGRFLNSVLSMHSLACGGDSSRVLVSPVSLATDTFSLPGMDCRQFGHLEYRPELDYHTSAVLGAACDTLTLPWRLGQSSVSDVVADLGASGRNVVAAALAMPFPLRRDQFLVDSLTAAGGTTDLGLTSLTPSSSVSPLEDVQRQCVSLRGIDFDRLFCPNDFRSSKEYGSHPYLNCDGVDEAIWKYFGLRCPGTATAVTCSPFSCHVGKPFPRIFDDRVSSSGGVVGAVPRKETVVATSVMTSWQSSSGGAGKHLDSLASRAKRINLNKMHEFVSAGLEQDEFADVLEKMEALRDNYFVTGIV